MTRKNQVVNRRDAILKAAAKLFAINGVDGTTVRDIGREVHAGEAVLYVHFAGKTEIAAAVFDYYCQLYAAIVKTTAAQPGDFGHRVDNLIASICEQQLSDPYGLRIIAQHHRMFTPARPHDFSMAVGEFIALGVASGELPALDIPVASTLLIGALVELAWAVAHNWLPGDLGSYVPAAQRQFKMLLGVTAR